jgi:hypothetical protein
MDTAIGIGVIILLVLWILSILLLIVFCSSQGGTRCVGVIPCILTGILTLILALIPKGQPLPDNEPSYNYSYTSLIWILMLTMMCVTLVVSFGMYFVSDIVEPKYARVSKTIHQMR